MSSITAAEAELDAIERAVQEATRSPPPDWAPFLVELLVRARALPLDLNAERLVNLFIQISFQAHLTGERPTPNDDLISRAVLIAEQSGTPNLFRKALSVQGLLLGTTGHVAAGLESLRRALDIAVALGDVVGQAGAWLNIAIVYNDSTLFVEGRDAAIRALANVDSLPSILRRHIVARALHASAYCCFYLQDYSSTIVACERALSEIPDPQDVEEQVVANSIASTLAEALIRLERLQEAVRYVDLAQATAQTSGSSRAKQNADVAAGLLLVWQGEADAGLARLEAALPNAKGSPGMYQEALRACVTGYERAGRAERALQVSRALIRHTLEVRSQALRTSREPKQPTSSRRGIGPRGEHATRSALSELCARAASLLSRPWRNAVAPAANVPVGNLASRLLQLKEALERGLITADEFAEKRRTLLDEA